MTNDLIPTTHEVSPELVTKDAQHFFDFIHKVILPLEPETHKQHSAFHKKLIHTACRPISATAAARGSLKSTILAKYRPLHRLVDPTPGTTPIKKTEVLIVSETARLAKDHLKWIKWNLTNNDILIHHYGQLADPNTLTWNEDEIELTNGNVCRALGYDSQVRGKHPTDLIVDDLESVNNMGTEESLAKLEDWFFRVLVGAMVPETRITVIGTIIARQSLLSKLVVQDEFYGKTWKALNEDPVTGEPTSLWPERWSVEWLLKRKKMMGTHRFNAEYQNEPVGRGDAIILPEWIRRHTDMDLTHIQPVRRYLTLDPAFTEERWGDYSAIIVLDETSNGMLYERLAWRKKVAGPELVKTFMNFCYHFRSNCPDIRIGIEEVAAQKMLRQMITEKDPELGGNIISLKPDKDKVRRLIDASRYFENGTVSLKTEGLVDELLNFPTGSKDRVDALGYGIKLYEQDHPVQNASQVVEIDSLAKLGQNELDLYLERAQAGVPGIHAPDKYHRAKAEALWLSQMLEEWC